MITTRVFAGLCGVLLAVAVIAAPVPKEKKIDFGPITDEQLRQAKNNLKQIGIALHAYHDTYGHLPANITDKAGKPLLSWRVAILPFVEADELYREFKLDEPWDSKTNKKLVEKMPQVYTPVRATTKEKVLTFLQGFDGPDTTFELGKRLRIPASFPDGTSNTIAVVEAGEPVVWTQPTDIPFNPKTDLPKLGSQFDGDFHVVCMDGAVYHAIGKQMNAAEFKKMVTKSDGQVNNRDAAFGRR